MTPTRGAPQRRGSHRPSSSYLRDGRAPLPISESVSRVMSANRGTNTKPELALRGALRSAGVRSFTTHPSGIPGHPDIAFPREKLAVFVHGCFWHRCPRCDLPLPKSHTEFWRAKFERNKVRDGSKVRKLRRWGWTVLVAWECQIRRNESSVARRVAATLARRIWEEQNTRTRPTLD
jgi:DNA mismatch endonuclease (patch repair protein)